MLGPAFVWPCGKKNVPNAVRIGILPLVPLNSMHGFCDNLQKIEPVERENRQRSQNVIVPIVVKFLLKLTFFFWDFYVFVPKDESPSSNGRILRDLLLPNRSFLTFFFLIGTLCNFYGLINAPNLTYPPSICAVL